MLVMSSLVYTCPDPEHPVFVAIHPTCLIASILLNLSTKCASNLVTLNIYTRNNKIVDRVTARVLVHTAPKGAQLEHIEDWDRHSYQ